MKIPIKCILVAVYSLVSKLWGIFLDNIEVLREKLYKALETGNTELIFAVSRELDNLILANMKASCSSDSEAV